MGALSGLWPWLLPLYILSQHLSPWLVRVRDWLPTVGMSWGRGLLLCLFRAQCQDLIWCLVPKPVLFTTEHTCISVLEAQRHCLLPDILLETRERPCLLHPVSRSLVSAPWKFPQPRWAQAVVGWADLMSRVMLPGPEWKEGSSWGKQFHLGTPWWSLRFVTF